MMIIIIITTFITVSIDYLLKINKEKGKIENAVKAAYRERKNAFRQVFDY